MGQTMQSGLTSITGSVTASYALTQLKSASAQQVGAGSTTIATVTAGKTAYIVGYALSSYEVATSAVNPTMILAANGVNFAQIGCRGSAATTSVTNAVAMSFPPGMYITCGATQTITITSSDAALIGNATVYYYEL